MTISCIPPFNTDSKLLRQDIEKNLWMVESNRNELKMVKIREKLRR